MKRTIAIVVFGVVGAAFLVWGGIMIMPHRVVTLYDDATSTTPSSFSLNSLIKNITSKDDITVAIFGVPGDGYNAPMLADAIIVAHFRASDNKLFLVSIPRDLWVSDQNESFKINEVVERDEVSYALSLIKTITGLSPDGYGIVDLAMEKNIIDWLGGIDVVLDQPAVDWVSGYTMEAGEQHLSGDDAVWLARNRYNQSGDFFREDNQQKIIKASFAKFQALLSDDKLAFIKKFVFNSTTLSHINIDLSKIAPLAINNDIKISDIKSIVLEPSTKLFEISWINTNTASSSRISVVLPTAGFGNYSDIRNYVSKMVGE